MATTCQHCGATTDNDARVMCPSCGRRMRPAAEPQQPEPAAPEPTAPPPPSPYAPPQYGAPPPPPYAAPPPWPPPPPPYGAQPPPPYGAQPPPPYGAQPPPPWPPPYGSAYPTGPLLPPQVDVYFRREAIAKTSRVTVLFRLLLALPHMIVLAAVSLAVTLVVILTWFVALVTAHVPAAFYEVLAWSISYGTRVFAYLFFLTDRWPTFSERPDSPVLVRFPGPHRLNRAAVLFRLVLMIPVGFLAEFVNNGLTVASVVGWLVVIVLGRVPQSLFDGTASTVRYQTRYLAYAAMLTARYPGGLFGDVNAPTEPPPIEPGLQPPAPPALNGAARRVVVTFLVLGVLVFIGRGVISAHDNGNQRAEGALTELADI